jgi:hypothetical protein
MYERIAVGTRGRRFGRTADDPRHPRRPARVQREHRRRDRLSRPSIPREVQIEIVAEHRRRDRLSQPSIPREVEMAVVAEHRRRDRLSRPSIVSGPMCLGDTDKTNARPAAPGLRAPAHRPTISPPERSCVVGPGGIRRSDPRPQRGIHGPMRGSFALSRRHGRGGSAAAVTRRPG